MHFLHHDHIVECKFLNSTKENFANIVIISLFIHAFQVIKIRQASAVLFISQLNIPFKSLMVQITFPVLRLPTEHPGPCFKMQTNSSKTKTMPVREVVPIYGPGLSFLCKKETFLWLPQGVQGSISALALLLTAPWTTSMDPLQLQC